mmetsp:Transcript_38510/g.114281  ORF Transcript_38510/g.114281 Transcript_38510/m.114281 type:complete len:304 (-) Transcript_38510:28-939(-)
MNGRSRAVSPHTTQKAARKTGRSGLKEAARLPPLVCCIDTFCKAFRLEGNPTAPQVAAADTARYAAHPRRPASHRRVAASAAAVAAAALLRAHVRRSLAGRPCRAQGRRPCTGAARVSPTVRGPHCRRVLHGSATAVEARQHARNTALDPVDAAAEAVDAVLHQRQQRNSNSQQKAQQLNPRAVVALDRRAPQARHMVLLAAPLVLLDAGELLGNLLDGQVRRDDDRLDRLPFAVRPVAGLAASRGAVALVDAAARAAAPKLPPRAWWRRRDVPFRRGGIAGSPAVPRLLRLLLLRRRLRRRL